MSPKITGPKSSKLMIPFFLVAWSVARATNILPPSLRADTTIVTRATNILPPCAVSYTNVARATEYYHLFSVFVVELCGSIPPFLVFAFGVHRAFCPSTLVDPK